jgi:hypothetical protein
MPTGMLILVTLTARSRRHEPSLVRLARNQASNFRRFTSPPAVNHPAGDRQSGNRHKGGSECDYAFH